MAVCAGSEKAGTAITGVCTVAAMLALDGAPLANSAKMSDCTGAACWYLDDFAKAAKMSLLAPLSSLALFGASVVAVAKSPKSASSATKDVVIDGL